MFLKLNQENFIENVSSKVNKTIHKIMKIDFNETSKTI